MIYSGILALALSAAAAARTPAVILPPLSAPAGAEVAVAVQERAYELLSLTGSHDLFHLRQVASLAAVVLGSAKSRSTEQSLARGEAAMVEQGARALALALAGLDGTAVPETQAATSSDGAMRAYASCDAALLAQPIGIETPPVLDETRLKQAISRCQEAVKLDPRLEAARGALALAQAIAGEKVSDPEAGGGANAVLAHFWVAAHEQSASVGEAVLKEALLRDARKEGLPLAKPAPGDEALYALLPGGAPGRTPRQAGPLVAP